mmetsp:Transcript_64671/g.145883  ORF Transcript_64671/g.145883 Transcript_64671/m.145883 type:complete len:311 (+) Transcript_64671:514-1446(+)
MARWRVSGSVTSCTRSLVMKRGAVSCSKHLWSTETAEARSCIWSPRSCSPMALRLRPHRSASLSSEALDTFRFLEDRLPSEALKGASSSNTHSSKKCSRRGTKMDLSFSASASAAWKKATFRGSPPGEPSAPRASFHSCKSTKKLESSFSLILSTQVRRAPTTASSTWSHSEGPQAGCSSRKLRVSKRSCVSDSMCAFTSLSGACCTIHPRKRSSCSRAAQHTKHRSFSPAADRKRGPTRGSARRRVAPRARVSCTLSTSTRSAGSEEPSTDSWSVARRMESRCGWRNWERASPLATRRVRVDRMASGGA